MFDGSHRSRRTIDLSGGNRRRHRRRRGGDDGAAQTSFPYSNHHPSSISTIGTITTSSSSLAAGIPNHKAQVLQSTLQQREERRIQQERQRCAKNIQRIVRGYQTKKRVATTTFPSTAAAECSTRNVSLRLSPSLQPFLTVSWRFGEFWSRRVVYSHNNKKKKKMKRFNSCWTRSVQILNHVHGESRDTWHWSRHVKNCYGTTTTTTTTTTMTLFCRSGNGLVKRQFP
jgi:hypothetical protein